MKKRIMCLLVSIFVSIVMMGSLFATGISVLSESPNFVEKDCKLVERSLVESRGSYNTEIIILTMNNKSEIYRRNSDGDVIMEEQQAYIRFMITVKDNSVKKSVKFFELFAPTRKDLMFRAIRTINGELKSL
ncbi:MAG: hypothetical protein PF637_03015 [Spirochaetes bacterium]|jgi:uncharacterized membrane protein (UPF0182 family)|nr:hypothetical protein [Spirochaetota bacterium]